MATVKHIKKVRKSNKSVEQKLEEIVGQCVLLAQRVYPTRYIRIEPKEDVYVYERMGEMVYQLLTIPKQMDGYNGGYQLVQEGQLFSMRRYLNYALETHQVVKNPVAELNGQVL